MQTTYTYAVIAASGATVFVSGDKARARLMLASCRADYPESVFALVLETCNPDAAPQCTGLHVGRAHKALIVDGLQGFVESEFRHGVGLQ